MLSRAPRLGQLSRAAVGECSRSTARHALIGQQRHKSTSLRDASQPATQPSAPLTAIRSHSSQAALHQSSPVSGRAVESAQSATGVSDGQLGKNFESIFQGSWEFARPGRTRLPVPLPPEITEKRSAALRRRLSLRSMLRKGETKESADPSSPMAFGDFTMATLNAINEDASLYTPSAVKENVAMLRACLSTGLVARASKIFNEARRGASDLERAFLNANSNSEASDGQTQSVKSQEAVKSTVVFGLDIYNAMLGAYMRKAWQEEDPGQSRLWTDKSWTLFHSMNDRSAPRANHPAEIFPSIDPLPNANTYAILAKGFVRLARSNRQSQAKDDLSTLLVIMRQSSVRVKDVITSSAFSQEQAELDNITSAQFSRDGEPDARNVLQVMMSAAADLADSVMSNELQSADRMLRHMEREADADVLKQAKRQGDQPVPEKPVAGEHSQELPELLPVRGPTKSQTLLKQQLSREDDDISFNLRVLRENLSIVQQARGSSNDAYERQKWIEFSAVDAARKRFDYAAAQMDQLGLQNASKMGGRTLQTWMWEWYGKLEKVLTVELDRLRDLSNEKSDAESASGSDGSLLQSILPFLRLVPPKKMALLTVLELVRLHGSGGVIGGMKTANALVSVGKLVEAETHAAQIQNKDAHFASAKQLQDELRKTGLSDYQARSRLRLLLKRQYEENGEAAEVPSWTFNIRARVGSFLVQHLMNVAKVKRKAIDRDGEEWDEEQPVFYSAYQYIQGKRLGVIKVNEVVSKRLVTEGAPTDLLQLRLLPMLVPPKPWVTYESGGYYSVKMRALRYKEVSEQSTYISQASQNGELDIVLAGLDVLGSTAWSINEEIFKVMTEVWNSGKDTASVPPLAINEADPVMPADYDTDIRSRTLYQKRQKLHALRTAAAHSQRCDANYKLEVARAFIGERFYFPHNMDFRGRAYPIPPTLNHIGNDLCRGLMKFADAKPLGESGLRWLRIHLANVYGFDKASFSDREAFAIDHIDSIRASVRDPLGPDGKWWLGADDPWQCLATCIELSRALDHPEGPEQYECSLPVHQDGTCNGLQHYAALGGDLAGAKQVNLQSTDRPSDVYTGVADMVIKDVEREAAEDREEAKLLLGKITRKVVKQTVMTTVYGVTFIGAKNQVMKQLQARGDIPDEHLWSAASYLARKILDCIGDLFQGADAIKVWLAESATLIAKSIPMDRVKRLQDQYQKGDKKQAVPQKNLTQEQMSAVIWTTPLGLPVVQPYRKMVRKQVATSMQTVYLHDPQMTTQVSPSKQSSAFPPNFIHSLDATHMFLTALECQQHGLTFASVHDSYWTHACDISTMNDVIRDTFIRLHSCDILRRLRDEFAGRYANHVLPIAEARKALKKRYAHEQQIRKRRSRSSEVEAEKAEREGELSDEYEAILRTEEALQTGFVRLTDLLPTIPEKGNFDVEEIRRSLYFFS